MKLACLQWTPYHTKKRSGIILTLSCEEGRTSQGEIAPLPSFSRESLQDVLLELETKKSFLLGQEWSLESYSDLIKDLLPSTIFGFESALLSLLSPLPKTKMSISALLMGSYEEILRTAKERKQEGFTSVKLKIASLTLKEAQELIERLTRDFLLRVDVNSSLDTEVSLKFFEQFPLGTFDYVEEPFKNPKDLPLFPHPLAIDESFPQKLSLEDLEKIPSLKAIIYKPTLHGGIVGLKTLYPWTQKDKIDLVLSSCFEGKLGLQSIVEMGRRLKITSPLGIGTAYFNEENTFETRPFYFS